MYTLRIIIIDEMHPSLVPGLEENGFNCNYVPDITRGELLEEIGDYAGIIVRSKTPMDQELLDRARNLKFIARAGAGIDNIDEDYCNRRDITILNSPEGNRDALGEHALGMLLTLFNKIHTADQEVRKGVWDRESNRGIEVKGKSIGIIGFGNMGSAFAQKLRGFECRVLAYDKYKSGYGNSWVEEANLETLFEQCDVISLHVPLTSETNGLYNFDFFHKFKKNIFLINTARGPIIPSKDLVRLLDEGKIKGAVLDVLENEKLNGLTIEQANLFKRLSVMANIVLTPHVGGWSYESYKRINDVLIQKITGLYAADSK